MTTASKRTRLDKLTATFEHFAAGIASVPDAQAQRVHDMATGIKIFVASARNASPRPSSSAIASGLEQALREMVPWIASIALEWRPQVSAALNAALIAEYPEFLEKDPERLRKIFDRGGVRTEAEFHLLRHQVDLIEGKAGSEDLLRQMQSMLDAYEFKG